MTFTGNVWTNYAQQLYGINYGQDFWNTAGSTWAHNKFEWDPTGVAPFYQWGLGSGDADRVMASDNGMCWVPPVGITRLSTTDYGGGNLLREYARSAPGSNRRSWGEWLRSLTSASRWRSCRSVSPGRPPATTTPGSSISSGSTAQRRSASGRRGRDLDARVGAKRAERPIAPVAREVTPRGVRTTAAALSPNLDRIVEELARAAPASSARLNECSIPVDVWAKLGGAFRGQLSRASIESRKSNESRRDRCGV